MVEMDSSNHNYRMRDVAGYAGTNPNDDRGEGDDSHSGGSNIHDGFDPDIYEAESEQEISGLPIHLNSGTQPNHAITTTTTTGGNYPLLERDGPVYRIFESVVTQHALPTLEVMARVPLFTARGFTFPTGIEVNSGTMDRTAGHILIPHSRGPELYPPFATGFRFPPLEDAAAQNSRTARSRFPLAAGISLPLVATSGRATIHTNTAGIVNAFPNLSQANTTANAATTTSNALLPGQALTTAGKTTTPNHGSRSAHARVPTPAAVQYYPRAINRDISKAFTSTAEERAREAAAISVQPGNVFKLDEFEGVPLSSSPPGSERLNNVRPMTSSLASDTQAFGSFTTAGYSGIGSYDSGLDSFDARQTSAVTAESEISNFNAIAEGNANDHDETCTKTPFPTPVMAYSAIINSRTLGLNENPNIGINYVWEPKAIEGLCSGGDVFGLGMDYDEEGPQQQREATESRDEADADAGELTGEDVDEHYKEMEMVSGNTRVFRSTTPPIFVPNTKWALPVVRVSSSLERLRSAFGMIDRGQVKSPRNVPNLAGLTVGGESSRSQEKSGGGLRGGIGKIMRRIRGKNNTGEASGAGEASTKKGEYSLKLSHLGKDIGQPGTTDEPTHTECACCHYPLAVPNQKIILHCCKAAVHVSCYCLVS